MRVCVKNGKKTHIWKNGGWRAYSETNQHAPDPTPALAKCGCGKIGMVNCRTPGCMVRVCGGTRQGCARCMVCARANDPIVDGYSMEDRERKLQANNWVIAYAKSALQPRKDLRALVLDCGSTTQFLCEAFGSRMSVVVANASQRGCDAVLEHHHLPDLLYFDRVGTFMAREMYGKADADRFDLIFMDFCGSYSGNATLGMLPREDLRRAWCYGLRRGDGERKVVAMTFSRRNATMSMEAIEQQQLEDMEAFGWRHASDVRPFRWTYRDSSSMVLFIFTVECVNPANPKMDRMKIAKTKVERAKQVAKPKMDRIKIAKPKVDRVKRKHRASKMALEKCRLQWTFIEKPLKKTRR